MGLPNDIDPHVNYSPTYFRSFNTRYHKRTELSKHNETEPEETINFDSCPSYDQSALNKIDPYINYLNAQNNISDNQYYTELSFRKKNLKLLICPNFI